MSAQEEIIDTPVIDNSLQEEISQERHYPKCYGRWGGNVECDYCPHDLLCESISYDK